MIDAFSRTGVGWSMGDRPVADLVAGAVNMAVWNRHPANGVIHHSDHGSQYTWPVFS
ncbi:MAG TPA: DDE-type integrase/transposase/recombinase [Clostridia bacterium]|nr:DDE-type integrase/transposase/recombinase [Clostridia bacterium]